MLTHLDTLLRLYAAALAPFGPSPESLTSNPATSLLDSALDPRTTRPLACTFVFVVPSFAFPYLDPYYYTSKKVLVFPCFTDIAPSSHFATLPITFSLRPFHAFVDSLCSLGFPAYTGLPSVCISQRNLSTPAIKTPVVRVLRETLCVTFLSISVKAVSALSVPISL
jgi:hypothetical protein